MLRAYSFCEVTDRVRQAVWGESGSGTFSGTDKSLGGVIGIFEW
ncbi:hypothetical protein MM1S1540310_4966 [Mycobacteroides abscessus subsp. bolletii 1S-154-0310]|uniref:Uncharacterized protein n=1 Tax=Mycobacteroides abscessus MAB_091912_2446 TaxID=1335414 RepID=A0A829M5X8_9MYCO|nr:hypothetical protein MM1S1510930_5409 [Mycobacteroides abscessus subsp. bolletii 1S-151-0930]EIU72150.1 hypothetical protein MM1S1530915_4960 [Mycobacteroides abscessus subsp. bolletii 1S-153-0915]EIU72832.1 hypothetical protein MM1S1520914_0629 [Mycobacteroides abscessus subsp. bolletii 1S-152-0914]EIU76477.1 hypothetical protein MM1S1540310_4966 [Mycobacteroides abscessus subsp. bolletii 1S-154-0310]EIU90882.1 hypothetical protein MM2B0626_0314 [Mycobacteroides abscessus subsp. bolletii 2B